jgi:hypothetical protein
MLTLDKFTQGAFAELIFRGHIRVVQLCVHIFNGKRIKT